MDSQDSCKKPIPKSRRYSKDRDRFGFVDQIRETDITKERHPCFGKGHDFHFIRGDRYGYCPRCGDECLQ